jgi:hypothetical protein
MVYDRPKVIALQKTDDGIASTHNATIGTHVSYVKIVPPNPVAP